MHWPSGCTIYGDLRAAKVIIVDEVSMLSPKNWEFAMYRLLEAHGLVHDIDTMLEQVLFLLVGDHAQLPSICWHKMPSNQVCSPCQLYSSFWWNYVTVHELGIPMRSHSDPDFADLLNVMRKQQPTQEHLDRVLAMCMVDPVQVPDLLRRTNISILCAYNKEVKQYNQELLLAKFALPAVHVVSARGTAANVPELSDWFNSDKFNFLTLVTVGAKVLVLDNTDVKTCVANGSLATVTALHFDSQGLHKIEILMSETQQTRLISHSKWKYNTHDGKQYSMFTFPLTLAYAMTVHKSQGATLDFILVDMAVTFTPGQLYIAISCVRTRHNLRILHRPMAENCTPMPKPPTPDLSRRRAAAPALAGPNLANITLNSDAV